MKLETLAVHAGYTPDPTTKAVAVPVYQTVAYAFDNAQHGADLFDLKVPGNIYTRIMNPTNDVLEKRVAALEGGVAGLALSAGSAAVTYSILTIAQAGVAAPMDAKNCFSLMRSCAISRMRGSGRTGKRSANCWTLLTGTFSNSNVTASTVAANCTRAALSS